jgi:hypothetical protein
MPIEDFARSISGKVFHSELRASRLLGCTEVEAFDSAFDALDATYAAVFAAERPAVLTRFRPITR